MEQIICRFPPSYSAKSPKCSPAFPPSVSVWLALVAHIRHQHTEYESLLEEGYGKEAARHFVLEPTNEKLTEWRATRFLNPEEEA